METRASKAMKALRKLIGRTQGEFAAMIGASKDAVANWETGRNRLSRPFARRIAFATGVEEGALLCGAAR
jgi:DNA-binding transcriptional regulator YiaG